MNHSYSGSQNQIKSNNRIDNKEDYLDSKIKNIGEIFNNHNNKYIYNIYNKLYDLGGIENGNIEIVIFNNFLFKLLKMR